MRKSLDKVTSNISAILLVFILFFGAGMYSGVERNFAYQAYQALSENLGLVLLELVVFSPEGTPEHFRQPARGAGTGVTVNERSDDGSLIFMSGFFDGGNELRLVRRDGTPVARWPVRFSEHFPDTSHLVNPPQRDLNTDLHGALVHPDGSVVFNYEYSGTVKLSRCGEAIWTLAHPTHHSIETSESGGYWIPGRAYVGPEADPRFPPFTIGKEDLVLKVSEDGEILAQKSVPEILYENGLEPLLTASGINFYPGLEWGKELVHVNKIGELSRAIADAFPDFEAGDLVISMRTFNLVIVVDPDDWKVKWHSIGPWRRQHDPEFNPDGTITVFNNNVYRNALAPLDLARLDVPRDSNIVRVDPATGVTEVAYGQRAGEEFLTVIRGKHETLPGGGFLITEFEGGRVFEVDAERRIVWEYINRFDEDEVLEVTEARLYPASYFTVQDWRCP